MASWLAQAGLSCYQGLFAQHHVTADLLLDLDMEALEKIGVQSWGHRCVLMRAVAARRKDSEGGMQSQEQDESAGAGVRGARKRGGERDKSAGLGVAAAVSGPAATSNAHSNVKDVYDQMENMKIHFDSQMEQLNRELQTLKAGIHASNSVPGGTHRGGGGGGGKGGKGGMNGGHEGGDQGKRSERGDKGGDGGGERGGGGKGGNKGGGKKEMLDHGAHVDASGMSMGMGGAQGYAYVGPQVCGMLKDSPSLLPSWHVSCLVQTRVVPCANTCRALCKHVSCLVQTRVVPCANTCRALCKHVCHVTVRVSRAVACLCRCRRATACACVS